MSGWVSPASAEKAREKFRGLVWTAVERLQPSDGVTKYREGVLTEGAYLIWGDVEARLSYEGRNGWKVIFDRGWRERRLKAPKLDGLTVDTFCMTLTGVVNHAAQARVQEQEARERRAKADQDRETLQARAAAALGFPLKTEGTYYNEVVFSAIEIAGEIRLNTEIRWRGLTVEQAIAIKNILQPGATS